MEINFLKADRNFAGNFFLNWNALQKEWDAIYNFYIFGKATNILFLVPQIFPNGIFPCIALNVLTVLDLANDEPWLMSPRLRVEYYAIFYYHFYMWNLTVKKQQVNTVTVSISRPTSSYRNILNHDGHDISVSNRYG